LLHELGRREVLGLRKEDVNMIRDRIDLNER
jgi:hypothetical protein